MRRLLGERVTVLLGADEDGREHTRTGVLKALSDDGEFDLVGDDLVTWHCWPAMAMRPAPLEVPDV